MHTLARLSLLIRGEAMPSTPQVYGSRFSLGLSVIGGVTLCALPNPAHLLTVVSLPKPDRGGASILGYAKNHQSWHLRELRLRGYRKARSEHRRSCQHTSSSPVCMSDADS
jgi:hypothetical protein